MHLGEFFAIFPPLKGLFNIAHIGMGNYTHILEAINPENRMGKLPMLFIETPTENITHERGGKQIVYRTRIMILYATLTELNDDKYFQYSMLAREMLKRAIQQLSYWSEEGLFAFDDENITIEEKVPMGADLIVGVFAEIEIAGVQACYPIINLPEPEEEETKEGQTPTP